MEVSRVIFWNTPRICCSRDCVLFTVIPFSAMCVSIIALPEKSHQARGLAARTFSTFSSSSIRSIGLTQYSIRPQTNGLTRGFHGRIAGEHDGPQGRIVFLQYGQFQQPPIFFSLRSGLPDRWGAGGAKAMASSSSVKVWTICPFFFKILPTSTVASRTSSRVSIFSHFFLLQPIDTIDSLKLPVPWPSAAPTGTGFPGFGCCLDRIGGFLL